MQFDCLHFGSGSSYNSRVIYAITPYSETNTVFSDLLGFNSATRRRYVARLSDGIYDG